MLGTNAQPCGQAGLSANLGAVLAGGGTTDGRLNPQQSPPQQPQQPFQPSPHHYKEIKDAHRMFDKQVARSDAYQTDGINGCHAWIKRTRNHLIGCLGDLEILFEWAEQQGIRPITQTMITDLAMQHNLVHDPVEISPHLWSWLGQCCVAGKSSETAYNLGARRNGLETWSWM